MRALLPILFTLVSPTVAAAQTPAAPAVPGSVFQAFLAALPDAQRLKAPSRTPDPKELARLTALNPGKAARLRAILGQYEACIGPASDKAKDGMFRQVAATLGEQKVRALTAFYTGPEFKRFEALFAPRPGGETLAVAEQAEADALFAKYPVVQFRDAMLAAGQMLGSDGAFIDVIMACSMTREEALDREGLRQSED